MAQAEKLSETVRSASAGREAAFSAMARFGADMATAARVDTTPNVYARCLRSLFTLGADLPIT